MPQRKLTIELPGSAEALHRALNMLLQYGLISENKARTIERQEAVIQPPSKSRWATAAERLRKENSLQGRSGEARELFREFREDFEI